MVYRAAGSLLGRHVFGGADHSARERLPRVAKQPGDTKIGQLDAAPWLVGKQQVRGLEIPVHDSLVMGGLEGPRDLAGDGNRLLPTEGAACLEGLLEAAARYEFHREEWHSLVFAEGDQADDARMPQPLERLDLGLEPPPQAGLVTEIG